LDAATITLPETTGFGLSLLKAVSHGRGDELIIVILCEAKLQRSGRSPRG